MELFSQELLRQLLSNRQTPCISLFMPTTRGVRHEDKTRWRNLVREAEECLKAGGERAPEAKHLLHPARELLEDAPFWLDVSAGLAVFLAPEIARSYRLPLAFDEQVVIGGHFHVKPLLPLLTGDGRFFVLELSQNNVRLWQGTRQTLEEIDLQGIPTNLADALQYDDVQTARTVHTHAGLLEFCQKVDRGLQSFVHDEGIPLVLAGVFTLSPTTAPSTRLTPRSFLTRPAWRLSTGSPWASGAASGPSEPDALEGARILKFT